MMNIFFDHVESYTKDLLAENADNLNMFEVRPGVYANVDPAQIVNCHAADLDLNR